VSGLPLRLPGWSSNHPAAPPRGQIMFLLRAPVEITRRILPSLCKIKESAFSPPPRLRVSMHALCPGEDGARVFEPWGALPPFRLVFHKTDGTIFSVDTFFKGPPPSPPRIYWVRS